MRLVNLKSFSTLRRSIYEGLQRQYSSWLEPDGFMTHVKVYNPITKSKVPLILKNDGIATWYMCGPTVYDSAHIGHACTFVRFDIIRRILSQFFNINVITAMSITDIDDKIIQRSLESKQDWKMLTKIYEKEFFEDMELLDVVPPYTYCRVTDYIPQIIRLVKEILAANTAYIGKDGSVYFDTQKFDKYGKLCKAFPSKEDSVKNSTSDFALWKASKPGEPFWESPWGRGRPGWHIECSAIASTIFGSSIDIHSGGIDLLFPHHENEEAQSCCYHGVDQWVNYWLHSGHLYLQGSKKMSKSLKNTISIRDLLKTYSTNQFRLFCLLTHYRTGIEFSHETMQGAIGILRKLENFLGDCENCVSGRLTVANIDENLIINTLQATKKKVYVALADDFDTRGALFAIEELVTVVNKTLKESGIKSGESVSKNIYCIAAAAEYVSKILSDFGFSERQSSVRYVDQLNEVIQNFVDFRCAVRARALNQDVKDPVILKICDEARNNFNACGVTIKDHKNTSTWILSKDRGAAAR